ncbi:hypothetical protein SELMODRAFT_101962 [Selaginella moellendorffii]|uniref:Pentacotripeptide-repeat region of PRORP domain-containing protein n=2 Tax=Selaginella moellendorffii TaxID=88036 RepID=D8RUT2_SELML|nr:hypothetical protein SELMODRAFT_101962 [Selaginella moellendorffii]
MPDQTLVARTAIMGLFAEKGHLRLAKKIFDTMFLRDTIAWNAMVAANARSGHATASLDLFHRMAVEGYNREELAFVSVLASCAQMGALERARGYFVSMEFDHGQAPELEHYSCIVDVLARLGYLRQARELLSTMPFVPNDSSYKAVLSACRIQHNVRHASGILRECHTNHWDTAAPLVLFSNAARSH